MRSCGAAFAIVASAVAVIPEGAKAANLTEFSSGRPDLAVFILEGVIQSGDTLALEGLIAKLPAGKSVAVVLNSPGGDVGEGMRLGRFFYRARIPTFVLGHGGGCSSACATAFLGGRGGDGRPSRTKMTDGNLGFHQFRRNRSAAESAKQYAKADMDRELDMTRAVAFLIIEYLSDIGEDMSLLHLMLRSPTQAITFLSNEDALTYGIHVMDQRSEQVINSTNIKARTNAR
jgi:hypothetical protein